MPLILIGIFKLLSRQSDVNSKSRHKYKDLAIVTLPTDSDKPDEKEPVQELEIEDE